MAAPLYRPERDADKITCPVLIIAAMRDNLVSSKRAVEVSKRIPKSELLQVDAGKTNITMWFGATDGLTYH